MFLPYFYYDFIDNIFGFSYYIEMMSWSYDSAIDSISRHLEQVIYYFEDMPSVEGGNTFLAMGNFIEDANESFKEIKHPPRKILSKIEEKSFLIFDKAWKHYTDYRHRDDRKNYFDIKSAEVKHLLYKYDGGEKFELRDFFLEVTFVSRKLEIKVDFDTLELRKSHENEFKRFSKI